MAEFIINQSIKTATPTIEVTLSSTKPLPVGRHTFQLVVTDDSGNESKPTTVTIIVADSGAPTAVLSAPTVSNFGQSFTLDGSKSFDAGGGRVVTWVWTYLGAA